MALFGATKCLGTLASGSMSASRTLSPRTARASPISVCPGLRSLVAGLRDCSRAWHLSHLTRSAEQSSEFGCASVCLEDVRGCCLGHLREARAFSLAWCQRLPSLFRSARRHNGRCDRLPDGTCKVACLLERCGFVFAAPHQGQPARPRRPPLQRPRGRQPGPKVHGDSRQCDGAPGVRGSTQARAHLPHWASILALGACLWPPSSSTRPSCELLGSTTSGP